jgi:hypothetical protein
MRCETQSVSIKSYGADMRLRRRVFVVEESMLYDVGCGVVVSWYRGNVFVCG